MPKGEKILPSKIKKFTAAKIQTLKMPKARDQFDYIQNLYAGRSLILTLNKSGKMTWSALFYDRGRPRRRKVGEYPAMTCAKARTAATEDFDVDKALASAKAGAFDGVADNYLKRHVRSQGLRSESEIVRILDRYVRPRWGGRRFADIGRRDVADLLDEIQDKHGATVADSVLAIIRGLMNWHQSRDDNYVTPIVRGMNRGAPPRRSRWLSDDEIAEFWRACESSGTYGAILCVLLLTGQRRAKVNEMKWSDINLETGEWRIAREEREKGTPGTITLPKTALEIIAAQPPIAGNEFVFAGRGSVAFNAWSDSKSVLDKKLNFSDWRTHDLRRTARKLMTRAKVATEVAELALGHSISGIQGVYDDPDEYRKAIDEALRKVEIEIKRVLSPGEKIVSFRR